MFESADDNAHFIEMPAGATTWLPLAQVFGEEWGKFDVPLAERFVTDLNSTLVKQFLHISLAEWEPMVQPQGVSDHAQGETVTIGLPVTPGSPAYRV